MFSERVVEYVPKHLDIVAQYKSVQVTKSKNCLNAGDTVPVIRETFKFIKEIEDSKEGPKNNVSILMGVFIAKDQSNYNPEISYTLTNIYGVITKVCESYAELVFINDANEEIKTVVSYDSIIDFYHIIISEYFPAYVARINTLDGLCKNKKDESYSVLERLSKLLLVTTKDSKFTFLLDGVLTREFTNESIAILRNLIVLEEFFVIPITSISGFLQNGNCITE